MNLPAGRGETLIWLATEMANMGATRGVLSRFKQPEYTGENRCMPCTSVNVAIAVVASVGLGLLGWQVATVTAGAALGGVFFVVAVGAIYFRGYLVPGTPELTKQYFPEWLLAWFDKAPAQPAPPEGELDAEDVLTGVGALEVCDDGADLCLTDDFRSAWHAEIDRVDTEAVGRQRLLDLLDVDAADVDVEEYGDAFRATLDGTPIGTWQSEAAFLADLGAAGVLANRDPLWERRSVPDQGRLLNALRLFIDQCPTCGGSPEFGTETVESCCTNYEVAAVECTDCDARLFETRT